MFEYRDSEMSQPIRWSLATTSICRIFLALRIARILKPTMFRVDGAGERRGGIFINTHFCWQKVYRPVNFIQLSDPVAFPCEETDPMKTPISLLIALVAVGATFAVDSLARSSTEHDSRHLLELQKATDVQLEILAPFLSKNHLGCGALVKTDSFRNFLNEQTSTGKLSAEDAAQVLASLAAAGVGEPVHTSGGWVMPILVEK